MATAAGTSPTSDVVNVYEAAVLLTGRGLSFSRRAPGHYASGHVMVNSGPGYWERVEVPAVTLDGVLSDRIEKVALVGLDIEGSEPVPPSGSPENLIEPVAERSKMIRSGSEEYITSERMSKRLSLGWSNAGSNSGRSSPGPKNWRWSRLRQRRRLRAKCCSAVKTSSGCNWTVVRNYVRDRILIERLALGPST